MVEGIVSEQLLLIKCKGLNLIDNIWAWAFVLNVYTNY